MAQLKNTNDSYGVIAKLFHWLIAIAMLAALGLGLYMEDLADSPTKFQYYGWHKAIGALVLFAAGLRLVWKLLNKAPQLPDSMKPHEKLLSKLAHFGLYFLMFYMPLVGWAMSSAAGYPVSVFGWFELPPLIAPDKSKVDFIKELHEIGGNAVIALVGLHFVAALYHHFWLKDNILKRMMP